MTISISPALTSYVAEHGSACTVVVVDGHPQDAVNRGLRSAPRLLCEIRHPDEPEDPFVSFVSDVSSSEQGPSIYFDASGADAYDGIVDKLIAALVTALEDAGVTQATLVPGDATWTAGVGLPKEVVRAPQISLTPRPLDARVPWDALLVLSRTPRPDGRDDVDAYMCRADGELRRLTRGCFLFHLDVWSDDAILTEAIPGPRGGLDPERERFTRLFQIGPDGDLGPVHPLGTPQCATFCSTPEGHLAWSAGGLVEYPVQSTELYVLWDGSDTNELVATGEAGDPLRMDGNYVRWPSIRSDRSIAYLYGPLEEPEIRFRTAEGDETTISPPKGLDVRRLALGPGDRAAVEVWWRHRSERTGTVGMLDLRTGRCTVASEDRWKLAGWLPDDSGALAYREDKSTIAVIDPATGSINQLIDLPLPVRHLVATSKIDRS